MHRRSGWRVRLLTRPGPNAGPSEDEVRPFTCSLCTDNILSGACRYLIDIAVRLSLIDCVLPQIRSAWQLDSKSSLVVVDPTSPNILQFRSGAEVNRILSRPFFVELQSRYGNLFYVREEVSTSQDMPKEHLHVAAAACKHRVPRYTSLYLVRSVGG